MQVRLPKSAKVKAWRVGTEVDVSTLDPGDQVLGYDVASRSLCVVTLESVSQVESAPGVMLLFEHFRWCYFYADSMLYGVRGPVAASTLPSVFMSYCLVNPTRMVAKKIVDFMDSPPESGIQLTWAGDNIYLWSEGVLVGR